MVLIYHQSKFKGITAIEVFEHLVQSNEEVENYLNYLM